MDDRKLEPPSDTIELPKQKTETINGQAIPVGTVDEFTAAVFGKKLSDGLSLLPGQLMLGIAKFQIASGKCYRLIWLGRGKTWLAAENTEVHRTRVVAWGTGFELAAKAGVQFSEVTR